MPKQQKTNAMRILEAAGINHTAYTYDAADGKTDLRAVAEKLGKKPSELFKTLVARGGKNIYVFCVPGDAELDLKKAAQAAGEKKIELVAVRELFPLTGYIRGGCSPVGMKKTYPLFIDAGARAMERIIISGGAVGVQLSVSPEDLPRLSPARFADLRAAPAPGAFSASGS
ncbi:MAG: Cys-tRNA(Pro) deacylase [Spirochaetia bacterium]|jgi:Cys-tRNA(Pro)/Cys-tRNA(Cys) deacylase|nr:Cys-tRNA(Pro) deacylase [Spirochaetia bacterium]